MSLLSIVEQAIKSRKEDQAKINSRIQFYREILHNITPQPNTGFEESASEDAVATDTDIQPEEKDDLELIEQALQKALKIRTGIAPSKKDSNKGDAPQKEQITAAQTSVPSKGNPSAARSTSKSASQDRKEHKKLGSSLSSTAAGKASTSHSAARGKTTIRRNPVQGRPVSSARTVRHQADRDSQPAASGSGSLDRGQLQTSTVRSKNETIGSNVLSGNDLGKAAAISTPSSNDTAPVTQIHSACSLPQQKGTASDQAEKWKLLKRKKDRLWDKVAAQQMKPVPGRSHFIERMRSMFPRDCPCGGPDRSRTPAASVTLPGHDLAQHGQTMALRAKRIPRAPTEPGVEARERLQRTAAELHDFAGRTKQEWEAWDRWRPEEGCLCPTGANGVWGDGIISPLPPTLTYTKEAELRELERLRMRVALLEQEIHLEQALFDAVSPQLPSLFAGPGSPDSSVLRNVYSLLGEGGERFPAIVKYSELD